MSITVNEWVAILRMAQKFKWPATVADEETAKMWGMTWASVRPDDTSEDIMKLVMEAAKRKKYGQMLDPHDLLSIIEDATAARIPDADVAFDAVWRSASDHRRYVGENRVALKVEHPVVAATLAAMGGMRELALSDRGRNWLAREWREIYERKAERWLEGDETVPASDFTWAIETAEQREALEAARAAIAALPPADDDEAEGEIVP